MDQFWMVAGMAFVTFAIRYALLPLSGRVRLTGGVRRALWYVPPAVLTAIIVPMALMPDGETLSFSVDNAYFTGAIVTALIGRLSKNLLITILGGMAFFGFWQWLM